MEKLQVQLSKIAAYSYRDEADADILRSTILFLIDEMRAQPNAEAATENLQRMYEQLRLRTGEEIFLEMKYAAMRLLRNYLATTTTHIHAYHA